MRRQPKADRVPLLMLPKKDNATMAELYKPYRRSARTWPRLENIIFNGHDNISDLTYYQGNFYADQTGCVSVVCEIEHPERAHLRAVDPEIPNVKLLDRMERIKELYLVESAGSLLVVLCISHRDHYQSTIGCRVFKVPISNGNSWSASEVKSLGNRALFLSKGSSCFSVEVSANSGCKANCIYFLNCRGFYPDVGLDVGTFLMEYGIIARDFRNSYAGKEQSLTNLETFLSNGGYKELRGNLLWI